MTDISGFFSQWFSVRSPPHAFAPPTSPLATFTLVFIYIRAPSLSPDKTIFPIFYFQMSEFCGNENILQSTDNKTVSHETQLEVYNWVMDSCRGDLTFAFFS